MPRAGLDAMRWETIIDGIAPAIPIPTPIPNVARSTSPKAGAMARRIPKPMTRPRQTPKAVLGPNRAATTGPIGANRPMHRTGIVVSRPAALADSRRSSRIRGSSGPMARSWGRRASVARKRPATTASGTRGASIEPWDICAGYRNSRTPTSAGIDRRSAQRSEGLPELRGVAPDVPAGLRDRQARV